MPAITDNSERAAGLRDAVEALRKAAHIPAKQRAVKVATVVETICSYAVEDGLDADNLRTVVQLASTKTELDQTSVTSLIKNLYPAQRVSADVVVTVVGALGQGKEKPSVGTQNGLVKWLITVYEIIDDPKILSRLYGVLFGMLDMISIRTSLCHLLSLITRRKHVKPFRIQQLLQLSHGLGNEPALQGLLRIYKDYYPDIILSSTKTTRSSFPPRPDEEWQKRIFAIQDASDAADDTANQQYSGFRVLRRGNKRQKSNVPEVHTLYANEFSVTLEEIDNADDFVGKLERIEPPGQMVSFLTDPLLQKYVDLKPSPVTTSRIELWLATCLEEEYNAATAGLGISAELPRILEGLYTHAQYRKELHPIVLRFLKAYLPMWNGIAALDSILGLLSYIRLQDFKVAHANYFGPAERAVGSQGPGSYAKLLDFYTELLQHWANASLPQSPEAPSTSPHRINLENLVTHVSTICTSLLLSIGSDSSSPLISSILTFYELLSTQFQAGTGPIILPPPHLSYLLAQSSSTTTLSRICGIYANYKAAFDAHPLPISSYYPPATTLSFNSCLRDLYNLLWGSKALLLIDKSHGFFCAPSLRDSLNTYLTHTEHEYSINLAFGLSHNAWLASLSAAAWWALEEAEIQKRGYDLDTVVRHKGPVSEQTLKMLERNGGVVIGVMEYKKFVLNWVAGRGCTGLRDVMYATHAKLRM